MIVINRAWSMSLSLISISLWWAHVIDTPDASKSDVFMSATSRFATGVISVAGHHPLRSCVVVRLER